MYCEVNNDGGGVYERAVKAQLKELGVCRIQRPENFSGLLKSLGNIKKFKRCTYDNSDTSRFPAEGWSCNSCGLEYFTKLSLCPKTASKPGGKKNLDRRKKEPNLPAYNIEDCKLEE